jgi:hypothetical protein
VLVGLLGICGADCDSRLIDRAVHVLAPF